MMHAERVDVTSVHVRTKHAGLIAPSTCVVLRVDRPSSCLAHCAHGVWGQPAVPHQLLHTPHAAGLASTDSLRCPCSNGDLDATERGEYARLRDTNAGGGGAAPAPSLCQSPGVRVLTMLSVLAVGTLLVVTLHPGASASSSSMLHSRNCTSGPGVHGEPAPGPQAVKEDPSRGMCRHDYSVPTWSGEEALVCDPAVCEGGDKLKPMVAPEQKQRRWSPTEEASYIDLFRKNRFNGWLQVIDPPVAAHCRCKAQLPCLCTRGQLSTGALHTLSDRACTATGALSK
jgi:hypothetical protein